MKTRGHVVRAYVWAGSCTAFIDSEVAGIKVKKNVNSTESTVKAKERAVVDSCVLHVLSAAR